MGATTRYLTLLFLGACAAAVAACTAPGATQCEATGILCPPATHCAAAEPVCIPNENLCGNAHVDDGEVCDDGNTKDGDGCAHDCKSNETCGNGITDDHAHVPEVCDDGNTKDGDGCAHDCLSKEICGNEIVDHDEVCDDGNDVAGDGCSHSCRSNETCGNRMVDPGEACDDPDDPVHCSPDCKSTLQCNNAQVDPGEECDIRIVDSGGNVIVVDQNDADCRADCVLNRCGDGFVDRLGSGPSHLEHVEECDAAPQAAPNSRDVVPTETSACNIDCTLPRCGDGKINRHFTPSGAPGPEQCDDVEISGATVTSLDRDDRDCTAACQVNRCGDGLVDSVGPDHVEQCDDGDQDDHNGCTNECRQAACGDGILKTVADASGPAEQCDDHNTDDDDGCSHDCKIEVCGDNLPNNGNEDCDTGAVSTATCNFNCKTPRCGDGIVNPQFKPDGNLAEQCDDGNALGGDGCSATCRFEHCGNDIKDPGEECDGSDGLTTGQVCSPDCHILRCGNGILDPGEECDDGNTSDLDDCLSSDPAPASCKLATCGDGKRDARTEECDDGASNGAPASTCSVACHLVRCGNGALEQGEACDDGNLSDQDDCLSSGTSAATACKLAACGDGQRNLRTEDCDDGPRNGTVASTCSATCHTVQCGNGVLEQGEQCDDGGDALGNSNNGDGKRCNAACQFNVCGDGDQLAGVEQCDDHNAIDGDGCDTNCRITSCGNGVQTAGEACDDGNTVNGDGCDTNCTATACGNGIQTAGETCDDGDLITESCPYGTSCTICDATCQAVAGTVPACGDGNLDGAFEACDDRNALACGTCDASCQVVIAPAAATGLLFAAPGGAYAAAGTDMFTLRDGLTARTFQFTTASVASPVIAIDPTNASDPTNPPSSSTMAGRIANAVNASGLRIDAALVGATGIVTLTNRQPAATGNQATTNLVTAAGFFLSAQLVGGRAGDCDNGISCTKDADCASNRCAASTCQACARDRECATNLCVDAQCQVCTADDQCPDGSSGRHCDSGACRP